MKTRCKMQCLFKQEGGGYDYQNADGSIREHVRGSIDIRFGAVYSPDPSTENGKFWKATPNASLQMWVDNHAAVDHINVGDYLYFDFEVIPK